MEAKMDFARLKKKWKPMLWQLASVSVLLFSITFLVSGCAPKDDNKPAAVVNNPPVTNPTTTNPPTTQTAPVVTLIAPETLKGLIDSGVVNGTGTDRVVILDIQSTATYSAGHIPGALQMNSADLYKTRQEGPAKDVSMVVDGAGMDALVQKFGIDNNTTIVITGGTGTASAGTVLQMTRAYFTFRYWGFPKEKLKFLDGVNFAWKAAYSMATGPSVSVTPSTYSVKSNAGLQTGLRASLGEMIALAEGATANALPVDMRSSMTATNSSYAGAPGATEGVFAPTTPKDYVVFEGHVKGGKAVNYADLFDSANNFRFKSKETLESMFAAIGVSQAINAHVY
jgi:3-mercaptopyruvate sulfurtransferase SseA